MAATQKQASPQAVAIVLVLLVAMVVVCSQMKWLPERTGPADNETESDLAGGERYAALQAAKKIIGPRLLSPASADWPWESITSSALHDGRQYQAWTVRGSVDAKNAAGVPLRYSWEAVVVQDKVGTVWSKGDLGAIRIKLDGVVIWGSDQAVAEMLSSH